VFDLRQRPTAKLVQVQGRDSGAEWRPIECFTATFECGSWGFGEEDSGVQTQSRLTVFDSRVCSQRNLRTRRWPWGSPMRNDISGLTYISPVKFFKSDPPRLPASSHDRMAFQPQEFFVNNAFFSSPYAPDGAIALSAPALLSCSLNLCRSRPDDNHWLCLLDRSEHPPSSVFRS
jgi:hypothetical protein